MTLHFNKLSWKKIIKQLLVTGKKLDGISFAQIHGSRAAERNFKIDRERIREWRGKKEKIEKTVKNTKLKGSKRMRIEGAVRKPFNQKLDESVLE